MATKKSAAGTEKPAKAKKATPEKRSRKPLKKSAKPAKKPGKAPKSHKESIRFPAEDHALFAPLKARAKQGGRPAKKSELVRVGLRVLITLDEGVLIEQLRRLDEAPR